MSNDYRDKNNQWGDFSPDCAAKPRVTFKPGTSVYKVNLYHPANRLNGSVEVIALNWGAAERLAWDEHVAEESYLG